MWVALALSSLIVAYNNLVNRWGPFHGPAYVPLNVIFTGSIVLLATARLGLSRTDLGLHGGLVDAGIALTATALFGVGALALARSRHAHRIADKRVTGLRRAQLAYYVLARIPIGTAVAEEVLFRGVLFAVWRDAGVSPLGAALCASFAFGLWHVSPTILGVRINDPDPSTHKLQMAVAGAVLATAIAGLALTWVRLRSGGLLAPVMLHGGINSVSALAAVVASRRTS
ncbi:MAG TPA: CPBP family intramembrane glutamic endopeptidase [Actinomycetota bacterium]|nr:CPBP family intramembrane glutamic endopeptidase [Actinomycetota bacterium]